MEYTKELLKKKINEMNKAQINELNQIFKSKASLSEAHFENIEDAVDSSEELDIIIESFHYFLFTDRYKYSAIFEVVNDQNLSFNQILNKIPVSSFDLNRLQSLSDPNLTFLHKHNEFALNYPLYVNTDESGTLQPSVQIFNSLLFSFYEFEDRVFVEICISNIKQIYRGEDANYFGTMINLVKSYINGVISLELIPLDFSDLVYALSEDKDHQFVRATGQNMYTQKRAQATLTSSNSTDYVIPILGELENFIEFNKNEFQVSKDTRLLQRKLQDFIYEIKFNSHYSWINLTWGQKTQPKSKVIEIKYLFDGRYTLLSYYSHLLGREGMRYATGKLLEEFIEYQSLKRIEENEFAI